MTSLAAMKREEGDAWGSIRMLTPMRKQWATDPFIMCTLAAGMQAVGCADDATALRDLAARTPTTAETWRRTDVGKEVEFYRRHSDSTMLARIARIEKQIATLG